MRRDLRLLRVSADRVTADLQTALGDGWRCVVDDELVLTLSGPTGAESAVLHADVEEFFEESPEEDADDVVATETLELLRVLDVVGPRCPQHGTPMGACSSVWTCSEGHDAPFIGELGSTR